MLRVYNGDGFEVMEQMKQRDEKVKLVLIDPPYGVTDKLWDNAFPMYKVWQAVYDILEDDGLVVIFGSEPFSTHIRSSNLNRYKYDWYWLKNQSTGFAFSKHQPMRRVENAMVFGKEGRGTYNPQGLEPIENPKERSRKSSECTHDLYSPLHMSKPFTSKFKNYPKNTLEIDVERTGLHPTQKPTALMEYIIQTYTHEGDLVLDFCMGSGTCGVAAHNTKRNFIGAEINPTFFTTAKERLEKLPDVELELCQL